MNQKFINWNIIFLFLIAFSNFKIYAQDNQVKLRFNGFGDITYGIMGKTMANKEAENLFNEFGEGDKPLNLNEGFGIVGTDFLATVFINENLTYQGEINLQVGRGVRSEIELDFERMYIDYNISEKFGIQVGLFFTPIGFANRNLYARAWLMNSIQIREVVEEEVSYITNHTVGANVYGKFYTESGHAFSYIFSLGNGRATNPVEVFYARDTGSKEVTGLLEWNIPGPKDFRIGLSGYIGDISTYKVDNLGDVVDITDPGAVKLDMTETVFNPYIFYSGKLLDILFESHHATIKDDNNVLTEQKTNLSAYSLEVAVNLKVKDKRLAPYIRYDKLELPANGGPFYGLRLDGDMLTKIYTPDFEALMLGVSFDISTFNRIKIEYTHHLDGPRPENGITFQTAFGF